MRLIEALIEHARQRGEDAALRVCATEIAWSWRRLERATAAAAEQLRAALPAASVVLLCAGNEPAFVAGYLGALAAGMKVFPISPAATASELVSAAVGSAACAIISRPGQSEPKNLLQFRLDEIVEGHESGAALSAPRDGSSAAMLLHSSGTTAAPKIVHRRAESLDAVAESMRLAVGFGPRDQVLAIVPLYHSYGVEHGLLSPILGGSCVHLCSGFELATSMAALRKEITIWPAVPFMIEAMAQSAGEAGATALNRNFRRVYSAGAMLPRAVAERFAERFGRAIGQVYGSTEVGSVTFSDPDLRGFDAAGVGRPARGVVIRILDEDEEGQGQVAISATSMFDGYLGEGADAAIQDGFFRTGDLGRLDEQGNLHITGRLKLLIDVGGLKINPAEVEQALLQHPGVESCVVVPMRVSPTVTRLKAVVTARRGSEPPTAESLRGFAKERLSAYKVPRVFEVRDMLPRSASGKILRHLVQG